MNEVDTAFSTFLKDWPSYSEVPLAGKPVILERRLSVSPHNSWRTLGGASFVSLTKETAGTFLSSGALKIMNFPIDPIIGLIFKLEYRVELHNAQTTLKETRDFVIGWCLYVPEVSKLG